MAASGGVEFGVGHLRRHADRHMPVRRRVPPHRARRSRRDGQGQRENGKQHCAHDVQ
jgi:hypothetical protein